MRACIPWLHTGEYRFAREIVPTLQLVFLLGVDCGADLERESPEGLDRLPLPAPLEALEAIGVVRELVVGDVRSVIAFELAHRIAFDRNDCTRRGLDRDAIVLH